MRFGIGRRDISGLESDAGYLDKTLTAYKIPTSYLGYGALPVSLSLLLLYNSVNGDLRLLTNFRLLVNPFLCVNLSRLKI